MVRCGSSNILLLQLRDGDVGGIVVHGGAVITLLAQFCPRIAAHLLQSLRLAQLAVDVSMSYAYYIAAVRIVAAGVGPRSGFFAGRRLNIRICDR